MFMLKIALTWSWSIPIYWYLKSTNNDRHILYTWLDKDYRSPGMPTVEYNLWLCSKSRLTKGGVACWMGKWSVCCLDGSRDKGLTGVLIWTRFRFVWNQPPNCVQFLLFKSKVSKISRCQLLFTKTMYLGQSICPPQSPSSKSYF